MRNPGKLDSYIQSYSVEVTESPLGFNTQTSRTDVDFWGEVNEVNSPTEAQSGKRRQKKKIVIVARARDVENVSIGFEMTIDEEDVKYQVNNVYQSDWKYYTTIEANALT